MHLVDLAGSERLSKAPIEKKGSDIVSDSSQQLLSETKNINLSLTYLEQVSFIFIIYVFLFSLYIPAYIFIAAFLNGFRLKKLYFLLWEIFFLSKIMMKN